jgi:threonine/homoserine/homoserine lactone efflux protein
VTAFLKGLLAGFAIAAAVGPIWLLCLRRALTHGTTAGIVSGLGVATADGLYGLIAALGLSAVSSTLIEHQALLALGGSSFLCILGMRSLLAQPVNPNAASAHTNPAGAYLGTLVLTLSNPMTILAFVAISAGLGLAAQPGYGHAVLLASGIFLGSFGWWILLSTAANRLRPRLGARELTAVNRLSGLILLGFGAYEIWRVGFGSR